MRKAFILIIMFAFAFSFAAVDKAEARGKLGERFGYAALGIYKFDDYDEDGDFIELGVQVPIPGSEIPIDIFGSYRMIDIDIVDVTVLRVGANVQLPVEAPMKVYAGGGVDRVKTEVDAFGRTYSDTDSQFFVQAGIEQDLDAASAVNARLALEDLEDLVGYGEYIRWFAPNASGFVGLGYNLSESDHLIYIGAAFGF